MSFHAGFNPTSCDTRTARVYFPRLPLPRCTTPIHPAFSCQPLVCSMLDRYRPAMRCACCRLFCSVVHYIFPSRVVRYFESVRLFTTFFPQSLSLRFISVSLSLIPVPPPVPPTRPSPRPTKVGRGRRRGCIRPSEFNRPLFASTADILIHIALYDFAGEDIMPNCLQWTIHHRVAP